MPNKPTNEEVKPWVLEIKQDYIYRDDGVIIIKPQLASDNTCFLDFADTKIRDQILNLPVTLAENARLRDELAKRDEKIKELEAALNEAVNFAFCLYAPDEMGVEAVSKAHSKAKGIGTLAYLAGLGKIARGEK